MIYNILLLITASARHAGHTLQRIDRSPQPGSLRADDALHRTDTALARLMSSSSARRPASRHCRQHTGHRTNTYIYMHMNTNEENIWIAIEDKDVRQDKRRGLDIGAEWAGAVVGAVEWDGPCRHGGRCADDDDVRRAGAVSVRWRASAARSGPGRGCSQCAGGCGPRIGPGL